MNLTSRICRVAAVAAVALSALFAHAQAADKDSDSGRDKKAKKTKEEKKADKNPASIFEPDALTEARDANDKRLVKQLEKELVARSVPLPAGMELEMEWDSPFLNASTSGKVINGWVRDDLVLVETAKKVLIAIRRQDGAEQWRTELSLPIRYSPSVSRNNVVINLNNQLIAIDKGNW